MEGDLATVIVTGGASGLGLAIAQKVSDEGGHPVVLDRRPAPEAIESEMVDLADTKEAADVVRLVGERCPDLHAVVTCAGIDAPGELTDVPAEDWERVVAVNLLGTVAVVRAALPWLERNHGRVMTVASTLGHRALSDATAYCASKFGVVGFTRALMAELQGRVGVTLVSPGGMRTGFFDDRDAKYKPPPDAPLCDPASVAEVVAFALRRPAGVDIKELVVSGAIESSWP
jgi:NAD(P)-dependent dehydrogenase (short-subunit alcohol dehydrogenase family)